MLKARQRSSPEATVLVVSDNAETLDGLHAYFGRTDIACASRPAINPLADVPSEVRALVLFPDGFHGHEVTVYLAMVRARRPDLTIVIITRDPSVYAGMVALDGQALRALVLPRPAFGWTILDAIRATLET